MLQKCPAKWSFMKNTVEFFFLFVVWSCSLDQWACALFENLDCGTCTQSASSAYLKATQVLSSPLFVDLFPFSEALGVFPIWVSLAYASNVTLLWYPCLVTNWTPTHKLRIRRGNLFLFLSLASSSKSWRVTWSTQLESYWSDSRLLAGEPQGAGGNICAKCDVSWDVKFEQDKSTGSHVIDLIP